MADDGDMDGNNSSDVLTRGGGGGGGGSRAAVSMSRVKRSRRVIKSTSRSHTVNLTFLQQHHQFSDDVSDGDEDTAVVAGGVVVNGASSSTATLSTHTDDDNARMKTTTIESNNNDVVGGVGQGQGCVGDVGNNNNGDFEDNDEFYDESYEGEWVWPGDNLNDANDSGSDDYFDAEEGEYVNTVVESTDSPGASARRTLMRQRQQQRLNSASSNDSGRSSHLYDDVSSSVDSASTNHVGDKVYYICNELLQTEIEFVRRIEVLVKAKDIASMMFGAEVAKNMFRDIDIILGLHKNELLPKLRQRLENWDNCPAVGDIMADFAPCLKLYSRYVANFEKAIEMVNSYEAKCPEFKKYAKELVVASKMHGLKVQSFMLEPVQRVPRYELLMKDYLKKLPENSSDRGRAEHALELIHQAASHYEAEMKKDSDMSRLLVLQAEMDGPVNLLDSHRELLKQGPVTLHRAKDDKLVDRTAFLFTDLLLICQDTLLGLKAKYKVKHIVHLATAKISDGSNEKQSLFLIRTKHFVLEFRFNTTETMKSWYDGISQQIFDSRAKTKMRRRRSVKRKSVTSQTGNFATRNIGKRAPILVHAQDVRLCAVCSTIFKRMAKKLHCEACGQVVCAHCCSKRLELEYAPGEKRKVCDRCHWLLVSLSKQQSGGGGGVSRNTSASSTSDTSISGATHQQQQPASSSSTRVHPRARPRKSLPAISNGRLETGLYDDVNDDFEESARLSHSSRTSRSLSQSDYYEEVVVAPDVKGRSESENSVGDEAGGASTTQRQQEKKEEGKMPLGQLLKRGLSQCLIRGRLRLSSDSGQTWRHLLCVLRDSSMLQAYADPEDIKPCLTIPMKHTVFSEFTFSLPGGQVSTGVPCMRLILHKTGKEFLLQPEDKQQLAGWRKALTAPPPSMAPVTASMAKVSFTATNALVSASLGIESAAASVGVC